MKKGIHPNYVESTITCACGNVIQTRSVKPGLKVEICSRCHPFFTGQQRIIDTGGKVERFMQRLKAAEEAEKATAARKRAKQERMPRPEPEEASAAEAARETGSEEQSE
ncbi:MAG: 50S ribosomal protein L31 [Chloroflexi bacterium]|nr:50S ribosomal protein L31 [Chloroflexota bacterium]